MRARVPIREFLFGTLMGTSLLAERTGPHRLLAADTMVLGISTLALHCPTHGF